MQAPESATPEAAIEQPQAVMPTPEASAQPVDVPVAQSVPEAEYPNAPDVALDPAVREKEVLAQEARAAYYFARDKNPDEYAKAEGIARRTGIPLTSVLGSMDLATRIDDTQKINFDQVAEQFPGTAKFLADPRKASMVHDDVPGMTFVEGATSALKYIVGAPDTKRGLVTDAMGAAAGLVGGLGGTLTAVMDNLAGPGGTEANDIFKQTGDQFARVYEWGRENNEWLMPKSDSRIQNIVSSGVGSAAQNLALLPLVLTPAAPYALGTMAFGQFGNTYMEDRASGKSLSTRTAHAGWDAAWEYVGEKIGLSGLSKLAAGTGNAFIKSFGEFMGKEVFGEEVTNLMQSLGNWAIRNPEKSVNQFMDELGTSAVDTFFSTLIGVGATGAVVKQLQTVAAEASRDTNNAQTSEAAVNAVNDLIRSVQATKTLQRDPETISEFVDQQLQDGVKNVYIKGEMLAQSDLGQLLAQGSPEFAAAMAQAAEIGGEVAVPIASLSVLPDVETLAAPLADHFRVENEKFTRAEAQEFMATHEQSMQQEIERVLKDVQNADQFRTQIDEVKQVFVQQLDATGRYDSKANDVNATLVANFFGAQAARFGMTPMDLYKTYEYKVQSTGQAGDGYSQAAFGPQFDQFKGDAQGAIAHLMEQKTGEALGALHHPDIGDIDLVWGHEGTAEKDYADGYGLAKIAQKHPEVLNDLQGALSAMKLVQRSKNRMILESPDHKAAVSLNWHGAEKKWMLSAYAKGRKNRGTSDATIYATETKADDSLLNAPSDMLDGKVQEYKQSAFHGSPYKFDKFSLEHMGNGEGAQAFGWGLYFASNRAIAEWYRDNLSSRKGSDPTGKKFAGKTPMEWYAHWEEEANKATDPSEFYDRMSMLENLELTWNAQAALSTAKEDELSPKAIKWFDKTIAQKFKRPGTTYEVSIPEVHEMLDWDKPLSEQPEGIKAAINEIKSRTEKSFPNIKDQDITGGALYKAYADHRGHNPQAASETLNELGIKGIKYLDNTSRDGVSGESHNYVVFDDSAIHVLETYNQGERGGFNPATFTTTLFKGADLSTFLHESGHFFLEMQMDMAAKLQKEAEAFGGVSTMTPGQQDMMRDTAALLKWFGVRDLTEWHGMTLDEKRVHHEQFARSFETYLYEGKAPSIELDSAFQTFRSWLANVYRAALDMVRGDMTKALDVKINDEVRGVMDRMLATTEQIKLAENARSMMPLFNSPQEAGMTQEEFAAYHLLSTDATLDAIQDLQARALRDMQWQRNAHGREVDRLKKLSESLRKQVRIEARAEILSQPVYRVYQFLTAKLSKEDKVEYKPLKSDPNHLDPGIDSLFTAIAKLGGLDRAEVEAQWGWDKKEKSPQAGIKYVLRSNGGLSIDMMAERLVQDGYLSEDDPVRELEGRFDDEARGKPQYSNQVLPEVLNPPKTAGETVNLSGLDAGRLELQDLAANGYTKEQIAVLTERGMTARDGLSADGVAALSQEFDSGDALIKALLDAEPLNDAIEGTTDRMMLERYGELATPEAIIQSADRAVYTDTRARAVAAEMTALEKALGPTEQTGTDKNGKPVKQRILPAAAKSFAQKMIARLTIRNLSPGLYAAAQTRAAKAAAQAMKKGDTATAAAEKRNELINLYAAKAAIEAQQELPKILDYFKKVQKPGTLPAEHYDQILNLLSKFDLRRSLTNRELDNRARFTTYVASQLAVGNIPPNIEKLLSERQLKAYEKEIQKRDENDNLIYADEDDQAKLLAQMIDESPVRSFKEMTVEEIRGLRDTIKQIEHMGRRTKKVLTDRQNREFDVVLGEMRDRLIAVATEKGRHATDNITANDLVGKAKLAWRGFFFSHIKAANLFHVMDGGDGGPIWDHLMSTANEAGANEAVEAGQSTDIVEKLLAPLRENGGRITGKKTSFPSIGRSLNKQSVLAMALNMGNESNQQRLLGGYGWTLDQIKPVLDTLTAADWHFVQGMWDHYESFRPRVGEMERTINGAEPNWIEARALQVHTADGQHLTLRGGYAPVIYDPRSSGKAQSHADSKDAKAMMQAARVASTVQKSFTKARVEEVKGRPLMLALNPYLGSIQDTIHYLNWQPWIIDANRMISRLDPQMREYYGAEVVKQLRDWAGDNAAGMRAPRDGAEKGMAFISRNVSYVGLAYNAMSALKQITGITQSMAIVGSSWMMKGAARTIANPRQAYKDMIEKSAFMAKRASTQFRELNELNAIIQDKNQIADAIQKIGYRPMTIMQNFVDIPTWWGAYEKAVDAGNDDHRSVLLADQAVVDAQGSGMQKDLSSIERQQGAIRLLTGFMSYMNTTMNANYRLAKNADFKSVGGVADFTAGAALINIMPVLIGTVIAQAFTPSGGSDEDKLKKGLHKLGADQVSFMFGQLIGFRELQNIYDAFSGKPAGEYGGPTGMRLFGDILKLAKQVGQGVNDLALWKSIISAASDVLRLPGGQINRTVSGAHALVTGKTNNPMALVFGFNAK
ncbi:hypothetical protein UFOVP151_42 [uncultured Caudovirales phage]|uniref:Large polyvalent protein associated domain-containing protein n=1 Tax=uncultured Caudovirales phage TaxID=2100421 RepID=A0A6J7WDS4_9CAUD|nr:hypothetical protein UFOVP151_42 [uncultured Caudovirales phage]